MGVQRSRAWWGLAAFAVLMFLFGAGDAFRGAAADRAIPYGLTGRTLAELEAESQAAYRMFDFTSRTQAMILAAAGLLFLAIVVGPYRRGERWAWRLMWILPAWSFSVPATYLVFGLAPHTPPPPPLISGLIVGALALVILLADRRRFVDADGRHRPPPESH